MGCPVHGADEASEYHFCSVTQLQVYWSYRRYVVGTYSP